MCRSNFFMSWSIGGTLFAGDLSGVGCVWVGLHPDILRVLEIVANDPLEYFFSTAVYQMTLQSKPSILPLLGLPRGSGLARLDLIQHPDVQRDKVLHYEISLNYHSKLYLANFYLGIIQIVRTGKKGFFDLPSPLVRISTILATHPTIVHNIWGDPPPKKPISLDNIQIAIWPYFVA